MTNLILMMQNNTTMKPLNQNKMKFKVKSQLDHVEKGGILRRLRSIQHGSRRGVGV